MYQTRLSQYLPITLARNWITKKGKREQSIEQHTQANFVLRCKACKRGQYKYLYT